MKSKSTALLVIAILAGMFLSQLPVAFAQSTGPASCPSSQTLRLTWGVGGVPNGFNHLTSNIPGSFTYYLEYQTLYPPPNPAGQPDWTHTVLDWFDHNANYTQWTMNIKPGLKWSDGSSVTSADILATMGPNFALNPAYDFVNAHQEVAKAYSYNTSEAVYVLNQSDAHFVEKISDPFFVGIFPKQATGFGPNFTGIGLTTIGSGPFYISNYTSGLTQAVLLRNPYYNPQPGPCEVIVNYVESTSAVPTGLLAGTSDLGLVDASNVASLTSHPNLHLMAVPGHYETNVRYNVTWYPYNMTEFRQALVYGINQSAILQQAFGGYGVTAYNAEGIVPPVSPSYYPGQLNYSYNPQKALQLLQSIGFTYSGGTLHYPNGTAVTLTLFADTSNSGDPVTADIMKSDLQQIGISLNVNTVGLGALIGGSFSNANNEQHSMLLFTGPGSDPGSPYIDGQPGYLANIIPYVAGSTWEWPPYAQQQFQGNNTIVDTTDNATAITQAVNNVQLINSQYLPLFMLAYPDETWIYSTSHWTNWGTGVGALVVTSAQLNYTTLVNLKSTSGGTTIASASSSVSSSQSISSASSIATSSQAASSQQSSAATTSSSSSSSAVSTSPFILVVLVAVIMVAAGVLGMSRRNISRRPAT